MNNLKKIYVLVFVFIIALVGYMFLIEDYIEESETNYTDAIRAEINTLIQAKEGMTFALAKNLSINPIIVKVMKDKNYEDFYKKNFFPMANIYADFKNVGIHIVSENGKQAYLSWTRKSIGEDILHARQDLVEIFKDKKPTSSISVGKFDMTFKGIVPIFDKRHNFLGIIEVITHFNSISKKIAKNKIYSAVIIDKRFTKQLKYPFHDKFIEGYNISNLDIKPEIEKLLKKYSISHFLNLEGSEYILKDANDINGYYVINVPIRGFNNKIIGNYIAFIDDKFELAKHEIWLHSLMSFMVILFLIVSYLVYKKQEENEQLIGNLNEEVKIKTDENLKLIYIDPLTGSYRKVKFEINKNENLNKEIVMLNIKNFSQINNTYSFQVGDEVLKIVAKRIENILKRKIYRIDIDEFIFVSNNIKSEIKSIKDNFIFTPINIDEISLRLSFSFAVATNDDNEILRKLSVALKQAKQEPFQDFIYYEEKKQNSDEFIRFNNLLYKALFLKNNVHITPYYQGIRNNKTGNIIKYEALARLEDGDKVYSPYYFINIAKNSGFLFEITKIMIAKTFEKLSTMPENVKMSINITEDDLFAKNLKSYIVEMLKKYDIEADRIILEILEGITSTGTKNNIRQLKELKEIGLKLAIDDFGVEYSNFERISELDIDFIKIDGKYIKSIHTNPKNYKIARAITDFARSMDIEVIAEFVENEEIQKIIEKLGINYSQGYCFSIPAKDAS